MNKNIMALGVGVLTAAMTFTACSSDIENNRKVLDQKNVKNHVRDTNVTGPVDTKDSLALVAIYKSTDGDQWYWNKNWLTKAPVNTWKGVQTAMVDGKQRVVYLHLGANHLKGTLPKEIGNLTELTHLYMNHNDYLKGELIPEIYNLKNLEVLNLRMTSLSGQLRPEIGDLVKLDSLDLWNYIRAMENIERLSGELPKEIGKLTNARLIRLGRQNFSGELPKEIGNLKNVREISIEDCHFTGELPKEIGNLKNLENLWIMDNNFSGVIPNELLNASNLKDFRADRNNFSGALPKDIAKLTKLEAISLKKNNISGTLPEGLTQLRHLYGLYLQDNKIEGEIPAELGGKNQRGLIAVNLRNNNLTGSLPSAHFWKPGGKSYIGGYEWTGVHFNVEGNRLTGAVPEVYFIFGPDYRNLVPQQDGYGFTNLTADGKEVK